MFWKVRAAPVMEYYNITLQYYTHNLRLTTGNSKVVHPNLMGASHLDMKPEDGRGSLLATLTDGRGQRKRTLQSYAI